MFYITKNTKYYLEKIKEKIFNLMSSSSDKTIEECYLSYQ